jgi:hypothetical protein
MDFSGQAVAELRFRWRKTRSCKNHKIMEETAPISGLFRLNGALTNTEKNSKIAQK